jgi:predicted dehydrogenase
MRGVDGMSTPLRVAVIGAGWGGELHLKAYGQSDDAEVVAICSRTRETAEKVAEKFGVGSVYTDFDEMADAEELDVVSVATPPSSHAQYTIAAAERGCHVLCDKPVALTAPEVEDILRAVEPHGVRHATGFISHYIPPLRKLQALVADGAIGEVREVHFRSALGAPVLPMTWMYDLDAGGGALMQTGQHMIEIIRWTLGEEITAVGGELHFDVKEAVVGPRFHNVFEAFGWAAKRMKEGGGEDLPTEEVSADTGYAFTASLTSGARAHFWGAWHGASVYSDQVEVFGSRGTLVWEATGGLMLVRGRQPPQPIEVEGTADMRDVSEAGAEHWRQLTQAFLDDARGVEHAPYSTLYDAWKVQQVCDAVKAATHSRTWESIPASEAAERPA